MMKAWKTKLHRGQKEGNNHAKKSLRATDDVKQQTRSAAVSTMGINLTSCLKKIGYDTDDFVADGKKSESVSTGVSKGSSTLDSRTVTTDGCSSKSKKVRFDVVEIRQYERIASDNPCCSSGPPIGIGWNHGETHRADVNDYEHSRSDRNSNFVIVLSRSEREELLLEWDVDSRNIASSVRAALKTKFQRKQTVINARKYSKIEEAIEITSKRLKKALLPRRMTNDGVDELLERTPSQVFDYSRAGETVSTSSGEEDSKSRIEMTEPDEDIIEKLMQNTFDIPAVGVCDECSDTNNALDDDEFTLGATTLGNTSAFSPSIIEMEKFYRELELEMFGEETELPSMVGQTLEVPFDAKRNITKLNTTSGGGVSIQDDMSFDGCSISNPRSAHDEKLSSPHFHDESQRNSYDDYALRDAQEPSYAYDAPKTSTRNRVHRHHFMENNFDQPPLNQCTSLPLHSIVANPGMTNNNSMNHPVSRYPTSQRQSMPVSQSESDPYYTQYSCGHHRPIHSQRYNDHHYRRGRGGSFDSSNDIAPIQNSIQYSSPGSQAQHCAQSHFHPQSLPTALSLDAADFSFRNSDPGGHYAHRSFPRLSRDSNNIDEPQVRHTPLHGNLSANQWMDGSDCECSYCNNNTTVTITEEGDC